MSNTTADSIDVRRCLSAPARLAGLLSTLGLFVLIGGLISIPFASESTTTVFENLLVVFMLGFVIEGVDYLRLVATHDTSMSESVKWVLLNKRWYVIGMLGMTIMTVVLWTFTSYSVVWPLFIVVSYCTSILHWLAYSAVISSGHQRKDLSADELQEMSAEEVKSLFSDSNM